VGTLEDRDTTVAADAAGQQGLADRIGHHFADPDLLDQALRHRSWCGEQGNAPSNERLEFLGDAVLGLVVAEHCYRRFAELPEGRLAKLRAAVVNTRVLAEVAVGIGLGSALLLGRGEESSGGRAKASLLADALEAVIGAVYLDAGWSAAEPFVLRLLGPRIADAVQHPDVFDHKSRLQERTVREGRGTPRYEVVGSGPDHDRSYRAEVFVSGVPLGHGDGPSKKDAEQAAARAAWAEMLPEEPPELAAGRSPARHEPSGEPTEGEDQGDDD
jgi:ribonuclease-3